MMRSLWVLVPGALLTVAVGAQQPAATRPATTHQVQEALGTSKMQMPKRTAEHTKLDYFAGTWNLSGQLTPECPFGKGRFQARVTNTLMKNGMFLSSRATYRGALVSEQQEFWGYDTDSKRFTYDMFSNMGTRLNAMGSLRMAEAPAGAADARAVLRKGAEFTWTAETKVNGNPAKTNYIITIDNARRYNFKLVADLGNFPGGGTWMEGIADKVSNPVP